MADDALQYLSLARKAGKAELGEEPVGAAARAHTAYAVLVAADASDHTWRRAQGYVSGTEQQCLRLPFGKAAMGASVGRSSLALAAITDPALALALVKALAAPEYEPAIRALEARASRQAQRRKEAGAHRRNKRLGKTRRPGKNEH